ncbi:MAG: gamma-glutamyltransferase, partial [Acidimicrobiia bacterium]|nr:gamma-glutamyltransferase [Acidimicrobiia bacterium]
GIDVFGTTAWTVPPNSQGYLTLAAAWLFEQLGVDPDPADPSFHHAAIECYRAVAWEREHLVADPGHAPLPAHQLLDPDRLRKRLEHLRSGESVQWPEPAPMDGGTAYLCTADAAGMGVSLIQSNFHGIGTGISAGATGVWLHNRGAGFTLAPGHPNRAAPGKRPLHTLSPTLWSDSGHLRLLLGTRGGHQQPQYLLQAAALLLPAGLNPEQTQAAPRWNMDHAAAGEASRVQVEERTPGAVVSGLRQRGHRVERVADYPAGWGPVSIISASEGLLSAAADPRVTTASAEVD